jgi:formylglycine-generating enzyme required for sulfatase activity
MTDEIFISYTRSDRERAKIFAEALEKQGYSVWWDRRILGGTRIDEVIQEKLKAAKCVIVLWSRESVRSDWVIDEADIGKTRGILIPVFVDAVDIPLGFRRIQTLNFVDWKGALPFSEFELLLDSVRVIMGSRTPEDEEREERERREKEENEMLQKHREEEAIRKREEHETLLKEGNSIGMKFVLIPADDFMMGSEEYDDEKPVHKVKISKPFYLGIYPVTQTEWKAIMGDNPSYFKGDDLPVESVSWNDVQDFIKKLNKKEGTNKYRLPSEAEWEYAARAGTTTRYYFDDDESKLGEYAWYNANSEGKTHEVGHKKPNAWGLYDMHGNVWEWMQDKWHNSYDGAPADGSAWESGDGSDRVGRGGSWTHDAGGCRSAVRGGDAPGDRDFVLGFRLLREM